MADHVYDSNEKRNEGRIQLWKQLESNAQRKSATPDMTNISVADNDSNMSGGEIDQAVPLNGNLNDVESTQYREEGGDRFQPSMVELHNSSMSK